jgi:hypothetical protein
MEKVLAALKRIVVALPYLTFVTVILYVVGREFNIRYWRAVGLPFMATDRQFADMMFDGFVGYFLWVGSFFGPKYNPALTIVLVSVVVVAVYRGVELGVARAKTKLMDGQGEPSKAPLSPRVKGIFDEIEKSGGYFTKVSLALLMIPILVGMSALTPAVPLAAMGSKGFDVGMKDVARYESRIRQLRDGLVDVSVVSVKRVDNEPSVRAIPMECAGDRCAAMTSDGPISLPKDRFGEESVVRANLTESCFTAAGLAKRRSDAIVGP